LVITEILTLRRGTADTFLASSTFFDMLTIWKKDPESEINSKSKFAKYHAMRILKAFKANEDPNLSNPVKEEAPQAALPPALDPNDPEVQRINQGGSQTPFQNPFQPYVESAPNTSAQPSPAFSASRVSPPPPNLPSAPTGYSQHTSFPSHRDVSPISQPDVSRNGSITSIGGGYFPRVDIPTFTADTAAPSLPTALSVDEDQPMTSPYQTQTPQAPQPQDPQSFYQNPVSPPPVQQPPHQPPPQQAFQPQQPQFTSPPPPQFTQQPQPSQVFQPNPQPPQQHYQYPPQPPQPAHPQPSTQHYAPAPQSLHQGSFNTDEGSVLEAQKHAKWAISALNFDDVNTAVKELRIALKSLGAN
jgi:vacuolar protein sorting-associated protein VTA1